MPKRTVYDVGIELNPNSEYHRILVKNLGFKGAKQALLNSRLSYIFGNSTYRDVLKYKPNKKLSPFAR